MKVIVRQSHVDYNRPYDQYTHSMDCPLYRAIKEQYPEYPLYNVRLGCITRNSLASPVRYILTNWDSEGIDDLINKVVDEVEVEIED